MRIPVLVTIFGLLAGAATPLLGQSLADVAKKEEERRKTVPDSGKAYSNKDLRAVPDAPPPPPGVTPAPASPSDAAAVDSKKPEAKPDDKSTAKDDKAPAKAETRDREYWNGRMKSLAEQLDRDRLFAEALQSRINALTTDFTARDDPAQRALIGLDRDKAVAELDRLRKVIQEDKEAIAAVEDEARRAAVPPGWLR
jgi:hypothetical protein